jgi:hypothetical protein
MSFEYYTVPAVPFEEAAAKLKANLGSYEVADIPSRYVADCAAFFVRDPGSGFGIWVLKERRQPRGMRTTELGSVLFEMMLSSQRRVDEFLPWVEKTLGVVVYDELGMPWKER